MIQWMQQWVAKPRGGANPIKYILSSDWRLKLASMKLESLVIADQHAAVNTFSNFALTARQVREVGNTQSTVFLRGTTVGSMTKTKSFCQAGSCDSEEQSSIRNPTEIGEA